MTLANWMPLVLLGAFCFGCNETKHVEAKPPPPSKAWTPPPSQLPKDFVDATAFVQQHGLADPRGGRFSRATVVIRNVWGFSDKPVEVYGWLMPDKKSIVVGDGLAYTPVSVLGDAKLDDFLNTFKTPDSPKVLVMRPGPRNPYMVAALLLIDGDVKQAQQLLPIVTGRPLDYFRILSDSYLTERFHRAVNAHEVGDDELALSDCVALQSEVQAFRTKISQTPNPAQLGNPPSFDYLAPVDVLLKDSKRRLEQGKQPPLDIKALEKLSSHDRIATLIDRLDEVSARQMGQPGGVALQEDPIEAALIKEGGDAVEPILDALEHDERLTRSVSFGRDFFPQRNLLTVKDAAYSAFCSIAGTSEFAEPGQKATVETLRRYWKENGGISPAERWMKTLADDSAGQRKWMDAAQRLLDPTSVVRVNSFMTMGNVKTDGSSAAFKGEALRSKTNPSITDLLSKRAIELASNNDPSVGSFSVSDGLRMALMLVKWDEKASLPTLQQVSARWMAVSQTQQGSYLRQNPRALPEAIEARLKLGDSQALKDYCDWATHLPEEIDLAEGRIFEPLATNRKEPIAQETATKLFTAKESRWNLVQQARANRGGHLLEIALSPLLKMKPVRDSVIAFLKDRTEIAELRIHGTEVETPGWGGRNYGDPMKQDPLAPKPGESRIARMCDVLAERMNGIDGGPDFRIYWPNAAKDKAIDQLIALLTKKGEDIDDALPWPYNWQEHPDFAKLARQRRK